MQSHPKAFDERRITIAAVAIQDPNPVMRVDAEVEEVHRHRLANHQCQTDLDRFVTTELRSRRVILVEQIGRKPLDRPVGLDWELRLPTPLGLS